MNIFEVLNQGKSRLHEPSISAMLGYLLDTNNDHGLGDIFLRKFIMFLNRNSKESIFSKILEEKFINAEILLEEPYLLKNSRKDIDIEINILKKENGEYHEIHRIIIENKIRPSSGNEHQLRDYYDAILEDDSEIKQLSVVFLTPNSSNTILKSEYENLILKPGHNKFWIKWNDHENSVTELFRTILKEESFGYINPINDYLKHTIKALIVFLENKIDYKQSQRINSNVDIGDIVDDISVKMKNTGIVYRIVKRSSTQIQVFQNDEKIEAKSILREIINENNFKIPNDLNTRMMGKKVIENLRVTGKCEENKWFTYSP